MSRILSEKLWRLWGWGAEGRREVKKTAGMRCWVLREGPRTRLCPGVGRGAGIPVL